MPRLKAANFATTTLVSSIDALATSFVVADASKFPDAPFRITIDAEIMEVGVIDRTNNLFSSVQRGLEGTTAASHNAGAVVENRWTAGTYAELAGTADLTWGNITDKPTSFPPAAHKTTHATGGTDALTPADIGAAPSSHTHTKSQITDFAHKSTHATGGSDALTPGDIGAASQATVNTKFDAAAGHKHTGAAGDGPQLTHDAINTAAISAFRAYQSASQTMSVATWTKVAYQTEQFDHLGEYNTSLYRFTASKNGIYVVSAKLGFASGVTSGEYLALTVRVNGSEYTRLEEKHTGASASITVGGTAVLKLNAGDYVEIWAYTNRAHSSTASIANSYFAMSRLA